MNVISDNEVIVSAGEYLLGDPCYVFNGDDWSTLLDSCDVFDSPVGTIREINVLAFPTTYGDGTYLGSDKVLYDVDSGLIGLVPVELVDKKYNHLYGMPPNKKVVFNKPTACTNDVGDMRFGDIHINTRDEEDEDDG